MNIPVAENPSCLQATLASFVDQNPSQMVPHVSLKQISTRPSYRSAPPTNRISESLHRTTIIVNSIMITCSTTLTSHSSILTGDTVGCVHMMIGLNKLITGTYILLFSCFLVCYRHKDCYTNDTHILSL